MLVSHQNTPLERGYKLLISHHRRAAGALAVSCFAAGATTATASDFIPELRESVVMVTPVNLGPFEGYVGGGGGEIEVELAGLNSADDYAAIGTYYYGPDGFDRYNNGTFAVTHDATIEPSMVGFAFTQSSTAEGDASPQVTAYNESVLYFSVSADVTASLSMSYDGNTNVGNDAVYLDLRRVGEGENPTVLETLFSLGVYPAGEGEDEIEVELLAGERYRVSMDARARSFQGTGLVESALSVMLQMPGCPADLNGDGKLDFFDVSAFLVAYNAMDPLADFTGDGSFDFFDVSAFLSAFSAGCP